MSTLSEFDQDLVALQDASRKSSAEMADATNTFVNRHAQLVATHENDMLDKAVEHYNRGHVFAAEQVCRLILGTRHQNIKALHLLATIASRLGHHEDAVNILIDVLDLNPALPFIRYDLANALFRSGNFLLALKLCDELIAQDDTNVGYAALKAATLVKLGNYEDAIKNYETVLAQHPDDTQILLRYGTALRIVGRADVAITMFRKVIELDPNDGEPYWDLANLKVFEFTAEDIEQMEQRVAATQLNPESKLYFHFALGKAKDDLARHEEAFAHYTDANKLTRSLTKYRPEDTTALVSQSKQTFSREYFESLAQGCADPDPIFIVGLPRSGSTLLEQILSNHSMIDATMELSEITAMVRSLNNPNRSGLTDQFPSMMRGLAADELDRLGQEYIKRTRPFRGNKPYFIDKAPNNFLYIGLIASILPNARIIDARRNPLACGFSIYTQYFARGNGYAYDLSDIGSYYRDYLDLMAHWDEVLPGRILTVQYEDVIRDMEGQVKSILDFCGLEFEPACLEFYNSKRAVSTISSEQVRQPIYDSALEHYKHYERYLEPLKTALGSDTQ